MDGGFRHVDPKVLEQMERLRLMYNRLFIPTLKESPTFQGPATSTDIHLYPTQEGSRMPRMDSDSYRRKQQFKGGPA